MHILLQETDNCPSWIGARERTTVENISRSWKNVAGPGRDRTRDLLITSPKTEPLRLPDKVLFFQQKSIDIFLVSPQKHILWILIRSASVGFCGIIRKQEAHRPRLAHLSDTAIADMQMLCNIFPILPSQLMKSLSSS